MVYVLIVIFVVSIFIIVTKKKLAFVELYPFFVV
jgi:hypothetical protein